MSATFDDYRPRHDGVTIPTIAIWVAVSLLLHVALLLWAPPLMKPNASEPVPPPLTAYLRSAPQSAEPAQSAPRVTAPPPPRAARAAVPPRAPPQAKVPAAPVIALAKPQPAAPAFTVPAPPEPPAKPTPQTTTPPPVETDLAAYIAARQRSRGEDAPPTDAAETANRGALTSAALKPKPTITFGEKPPTPSGGLFQIRRRGYDYAEFMFYGWNQNFGRAVPQLIEVRKDSHSDIDVAVIRKIIALIRDHERGDFQWHSKRTGKNLTLSARARDNAGLEEFMMQEFYEELHRYR